MTTVQVPAQLKKGQIVEVHDINRHLVIQYIVCHGGFKISGTEMWEYMVEKLAERPLKEEEV